MKKTIFSLSIVAIIILANNSFGQIIRFQKTIGGIYYERAYSVRQTTDGGYIITGEVEGLSADSLDIYLIKTNPNGDTLWTKTFGGIYYERAYSVQQTTDGGYIIAGGTKSFGKGNKDVYLIKTNSNGDTLWTKTFGGSDYDEGYSVQQTTDGGYIIAGLIGIVDTLGSDVFLIKTDTKGDTLWTKSLGGSGYEWAKSVQQTIDEGYIIAGQTGSFGAGANDVYLIKTNPDGDTLWTKTFGRTGNESAITIQQTTDGGYFIVGYMQSTVENTFDIYLIKTNQKGDTLWTRALGGTGNEIPGFAQQTTDGGYIIAGSKNNLLDEGTRTDVYLVKTDSNGEILWEKTIGGTADDGAYSVQQTTDGGYIIAGETWSFGVSGTDVYLIKTDANGNIYPNIIDERTIEDWFLTIYPNPSNGKFDLSVNRFHLSYKALQTQKENSIKEIKVYNILGKIIHRISYTGHGTQRVIDLSKEQAGIYFLQLYTDEGTVYRKLLKE